MYDRNGNNYITENNQVSKYQNDEIKSGFIEIKYLIRNENKCFTFNFRARLAF
jgi:hypothetical protein